VSRRDLRAARQFPLSIQDLSMNLNALCLLLSGEDTHVRRGSSSGGLIMFSAAESTGF
jgi:hypothetical protein